MRWPWPKREVISRGDLSKLIYRAFDHYSEPLLDPEFVLFDGIADFLNVCPHPKKYKKDKYDCNRQVIEVLGKLQGFAVGGVVVPWKRDGRPINHSMLIVCCQDRVIRMFDVSSRSFHVPHKIKPVKLWL